MNKTNTRTHTDIDAIISIRYILQLVDFPRKPQGITYCIRSHRIVRVYVYTIADR